MSREYDLRNIDQYGLESWIIATLATRQNTYLNVRMIFQNAPDSLVNIIDDDLHLERFLNYLESKYLLCSGSFGWTLSDNGLLYFRKFVHPISKALQDKKRYESIINSGDSSDKVKKELKKFLGTVRDKVSDQITSEIIRYMTMRGQEELWEIIRIIMEFGNSRS